MSGGMIATKHKKMEVNRGCYIDVKDPYVCSHSVDIKATSFIEILDCFRWR